MRYSKCVRCAGLVGWLGLFTNLALLILKGFVGVISGSQALVADALYSAKDVINSLLVIVGLKISKRPLDKEHPYGHGKIEFVLSMIVSVIFLAVTAFLFVHALQILMNGDEHKAPHLIALWTALISVAVNVFMYFYSRCVSIEMNSPMVRTLSRHHYADATSSSLVALGIIGAHYLGMPWIDTTVALLEFAHLMYLGSEVFRDSYKGLMDRNAPDELRDKIAHHVQKTEGVEAIEELRTRFIGQEIWIDLVIQVDPDLTVDEADEIGESLTDLLAQKIPHLGSVQVKYTSAKKDLTASKDDDDDLADVIEDPAV